MASQRSRWDLAGMHMDLQSCTGYHSPSQARLSAVLVSMDSTLMSKPHAQAQKCKAINDA